MDLQPEEKIIHEMRPERKVAVLWLFTKCLPAGLVAAFLTFWAFGFFGGMFLVSKASKQASRTNTSDTSPALKRHEVAWPISMGGEMALYMGPGLFVLGIFYCMYLQKTYVYYITNQRVIFHGGILRRVERSVPYHKITDVEMSQNIIEILLGISTLKLFTPGTASMARSPFGTDRAEITFVGLKDNKTPAKTVNEILMKFKATGE